jgi:hypothetical protein
MDGGLERFGERLCYMGAGYLIATGVQSWDGPRHLIPVYILIAGLILAARWAVVTSRNRRDARRANQPG